MVEYAFHHAHHWHDCAPLTHDHDVADRVGHGCHVDAAHGHDYDHGHDGCRDVCCADDGHAHDRHPIQLEMTLVVGCVW